MACKDSVEIELQWEMPPYVSPSVARLIQNAESRFDRNTYRYNHSPSHKETHISQRLIHPSTHDDAATRLVIFYWLCYLLTDGDITGGYIGVNRELAKQHADVLSHKRTLSECSDLLLDIRHALGVDGKSNNARDRRLY